MTGPVYPHADLTHAVIGAFYEVDNTLGAGFPSMRDHDLHEKAPP